MEIAKLKRQIREAEAPLEIENRVQELEKQISIHKGAILELIRWKKETDEWEKWVNKSLAIGLETYNCSNCGTRGKIALNIRCTKCEDQTWWGYFE